MPFFSVVIPTFNRAESINKAIDSVLCQTFTDLEVLVIDDGSTDDTQTKLERYKSDQRVRLFSQVNAGASAARNIGIDFAAGEFIAFLDSDDEYTPEHLEKTRASISANPGAQVFSCCLQYQRGHTSFIKPFSIYQQGMDVSEYLLCMRGSFLTCSMVVRNDLCKQVRFNPSIGYGDDQDFAIRLANSNARFVQLQHVGGRVSDPFQEGRLSQSVDYQNRENWLESISPLISEKAYRADKGWILAKALAQERHYLRAARNYLVAVLSGCYGPKMTLIVAAQVFLPTTLYYRISTWVANRNELV